MVSIWSCCFSRCFGMAATCVPTNTLTATKACQTPMMRGVKDGNVRTGKVPYSSAEIEKALAHARARVANIGNSKQFYSFTITSKYRFQVIFALFVRVTQATPKNSQVKKTGGLQRLAVFANICSSMIRKCKRSSQVFSLLPLVLKLCCVERTCCKHDKKNGTAPDNPM